MGPKGSVSNSRTFCPGAKGQDLGTLQLVYQNSNPENQCINHVKRNLHCQLSSTLVFLFLAGATYNDVTVTPMSNFTVPVTYRKNINYDCMVAPGARPEWVIDKNTLLNPNDMITSQIVGNGIFIEIISPVVTRLVITPEARDARLQDESINTIECKCRGVFKLDQEETTTVAVSVLVTIYSELHTAHISCKRVCLTHYVVQQSMVSSLPGTILNLVYLPDRPEAPGNLTLDLIAGRLALVWERPVNALAQTITTYNISIFDVTDSGKVPYKGPESQSATRYSIHALEKSLHGMPCQQFQFLVTAENDAGVGITALYSETMPLCK